MPQPWPNSAAILTLGFALSAVEEVAGAPPNLSEGDRELVDLMIRNGWSVEDAEAEVIEQLAEAMADELHTLAIEAASE